MNWAESYSCIVDADAERADAKRTLIESLEVEARDKAAEHFNEASYDNDCRVHEAIWDNNRINAALVDARMSTDQAETGRLIHEAIAIARMEYVAGHWRAFAAYYAEHRSWPYRWKHVAEGLLMVERGA